MPKDCLAYAPYRSCPLSAPEWVHVMKEDSCPCTPTPSTDGSQWQSEEPAQPTANKAVPPPHKILLV